MVDSAINHALINQAGVLSNTVFNAVARTFKEGQVPPDYVGLSHHQPGSPVVTAPSAAIAAAGTQTTVPPSTLGVTNAQSTSMTTNPPTSDEQIKLTTYLLASAEADNYERTWCISDLLASAEADNYERTRCISGEVWERDFLKVADYEIRPIQAVGSDEGF